MRKTAATVIMAVVMVLVPQAAQAATYYGHTAASVARHIDCRHFVSTGGGGTTYKSGVCYLSGKRVNVITFRSKTQQASWNSQARAAFPAYFYWGNGYGALVVAKNGNYPAAALGARRLPGAVRHG